MNGTIKGIHFTYLGYYFSSPKGTVQFLTYTSVNLLEEYRKDLEELLNGFVKTEYYMPRIIRAANYPMLHHLSYQNNISTHDL